MGAINELSVSLDVIDAAILACFRGWASGVVEFKREATTLGSVTYWISQNELGDLGEIHLRKKSENVSEIDIDDPPSPQKRGITQDEKDTFQFVQNKEEKQRALVAILTKISSESDDHKRRLTEYHTEVIESIFQYLRRDKIFNYPVKSTSLESQGEKSSRDSIVKIQGNTVKAEDVIGRDKFEIKAEPGSTINVNLTTDKPNSKDESKSSGE